MTSPPQSQALLALIEALGIEGLDSADSLPLWLTVPMASLLLMIVACAINHIDLAICRAAAAVVPAGDGRDDMGGEG